MRLTGLNADDNNRWGFIKRFPGFSQWLTCHKVGDVIFEKKFFDNFEMTYDFTI